MQGSLLDILRQDAAPAGVGLAGVMPSIRAAMARVAKGYPEGRKALPEAISEVAAREGIALTPKGGKSISLEILEKWLQAGDREHTPRLEAILCFCVAAQDFSPLAPLWRACGLAVVPAAELPLLEYGKACDAEKKAKERKRKIGAML